MDLNILNQMMELAETDAEAQASAAYISGHLRSYLKKGERVLICFATDRKGGLGWIMEQAVLQCGGIPVVWGPDYRWKAVLQQAFYSHASLIIGPPLVILGLSKLVKATATPLYIRNVVTAGYPCADWMIDGIIKGLDCGTWGCFGPGISPIVSGFSCGKSRGVHIREEAYEVTVNAKEGHSGNISIRDKRAPEHVLPSAEYGRLEFTPCVCGRSTARLMDIGAADRLGPELDGLQQQLHSWTSILDVRLEKGESGLEMELVVFPGQKLPKLPTCAKRIIRAWNPETDEPFGLVPAWEKWGNAVESH